jgi:predicted DNA-binding transcriptional regulator AlpA
MDLAAVRASVRKAVVETEVERRAHASSDRWLRQAELEKITGLRRTTLWKLRREDPTFPKARTPTGGRAIRFRESEVRRWMAERTRKANGEGRPAGTAGVAVG